MKFFASQFTQILHHRAARRNTKLLLRFLVILALLVTGYSVLFHFFMQLEGKDYSWVTGFYWTLTVMSTLGFGDITFAGDLGKAFSVVVLLTGMLFLLVLLPFTFIEFFYAPWMAAQTAARAPRDLPESIRRHLVLTRYGPITRPLIKKLSHYQIPYVVLVPDIADAIPLVDDGIRVVVGDLDDPSTYERLRVQHASLVATTATDTINTNVAFTVREVSPSVPIVATASEEASVDILRLAGCSHVLQWAELMGRMFARYTVGGDAIAHTIGRWNHVIVAEANASGTPLTGKTVRETRLEELTGVAVLGLLERGEFSYGHPDTRVGERSILLLAGTREQLDAYNELFCIYNAVDAPVVIIGGGRVGRATGRMLTERKIDHRIIEKVPGRMRDQSKCIVGDAAELEVLHEAGILKTPAVIITTHDDDMNIYLTLYCRKLRPGIQIISRATLERNAPTLNRAGADVVLSYATIGANTIFNYLKSGSILMIDEGMNMFTVPVPDTMAGTAVRDLAFDAHDDRWIIGIKANGDIQVKPDPSTTLEAGAEVLCLGTVEAEYAIVEQFSARRPA